MAFQQGSALSSAVEHFLHTEGVAGSNPAARTIPFVYQGQQIKLCDKSETADFDKDPAKYLKKLAEAEKAPTST